MLIGGKESGLCDLRVSLANEEKSHGEGGPVSAKEQHLL